MCEFRFLEFWQNEMGLSHHLIKLSNFMKDLALLHIMGDQKTFRVDTDHIIEDYYLIYKLKCVLSIQNWKEISSYIFCIAAYVISLDQKLTFEAVESFILVFYANK